MRRTRFTVVSLATALACTSGSIAQNPPGFTEIIEINYTLAAGEVFDFVLVDDAGGITEVSVGDPDGDGVITVNVPLETVDKYSHAPSCAWLIWLNEPWGVPSDPSMSGLVPLIVDPTGLSLLPVFSITDVDQMPPLLIGQTFEVVNGVASEYKVATIRAPGVPFDQVPLSQMADPENFPLYTGTAFVSELLDTTVTITCLECPWDCGDCDGVVGIIDFLTLLAQWGMAGTCDLDGDGVVGIVDFLEMLAAWGPC